MERVGRSAGLAFTPEDGTMNLPNEIWYALGGLILALVAQRLKLPLPTRSASQPTEIRETIRQILAELLTPPTAPKPVDEEQLKKRLQELNK